MQTETRTKKDEESMPRREGREGRSRPFGSNIGIRFDEARSGFQGAEWGLQAYGTQVPPSGSAGGFAGMGAYGTHAYGGQGFPQATPGIVPNQGAFASIGSPGTVNVPNPLAAVAPTLSYGLAGLADLLYRGVALATAQGQALLNTVSTPMTGFGSRGVAPGNVAWPSARLPATDIVDEGAELVCQVELPGVKPENVEVSCFGRTVLVSAFAEPEIDLGALVQAERGLQASYRRAINLPAPVQPGDAKATLRDGVLTINLPKSNPTEGPRRIPVNAGTP